MTSSSSNYSAFSLRLSLSSSCHSCCLLWVLFFIVITSDRGGVSAFSFVAADAAAATSDSAIANTEQKEEGEDPTHLRHHHQRSPGSIKSSFSHLLNLTNDDHHPDGPMPTDQCRQPSVRQHLRTTFQEQQQNHLPDSDGIVRTYSGCYRKSDGSACEQCCDGKCCEIVENLPTFLSTEQLWIPIHFIVIRDDLNSTFGGYASAKTQITSRALQQLTTLNQAFRGARMWFYLSNLSVFDDPKMVASCQTDPCYTSRTCDFYTYTMNKARMNSENVVNVVVCKGITYYGEAQFPWATTEDHNEQYIEVAYRAWGAGGYSGALGKTLVHEMGHYFGLLHIFEREGFCDPEGDYVDDTPSMSIRATQQEACNTQRDSCPHDGLGNDDFYNYMNYAADTCMTRFSVGQIDRMHQCAKRYRPKLFANTRVLSTDGSCDPNEATPDGVERCRCIEAHRSPKDRCVSNVSSAPPTPVPIPRQNQGTGSSDDDRKISWFGSGISDSAQVGIVVLLVAVMTIATLAICAAVYWKCCRKKTNDSNNNSSVTPPPADGGKMDSIGPGVAAGVGSSGGGPAAPAGPATAGAMSMYAEDEEQADYRYENYELQTVQQQQPTAVPCHEQV